MRITVFLLSFFLVSCTGTYSTDPEVAAIQKWTDVCGNYKETLRLVNDSLELQVLDANSDAVQAMARVKRVLSPVCTSSLPPADVERETLQVMLDEQLRQLILIRRGLQ